MKYILFSKLYFEAMESNNLDMYVAERGWQDWMDEYGEDDADSIADVLEKIYNLAKMDLRGMRESRGFNRAEFCRLYNIPSRTVQSWEYGTTKMSDYDRSLIAYTFFIDGGDNDTKK